MTENTTHQPVLTDIEILELFRFGESPERIIKNGRAIESALLSKLRAEGVQAGGFPAYINDDSQPLQYRLGWNNCLSDCRSALASAPIDPEAAEVDFLIQVIEKLETWRAEEWNELIERRPAILALLRPLVMASAPVAGEAVPLELRGVAEAVKDADGFWRSCTGCHELNEGHDTGSYSAVLGCYLGNGCNECGGIGAIWDSTDYQAMADDMARDMGQSVETQASLAVRPCTCQPDWSAALSAQPGAQKEQI